MRRSRGAYRGSRAAGAQRESALRSALLALLALLAPAGLVAQEEQEQSAGDGRPDSHPVKEGDTLWDLSGRYLESSYEWPRLWSYNPEITNPHWIYPGHVLRLRDGGPGGYSTPTEGGAEPSTRRVGLVRMKPRSMGTGPNSVRLGEHVYLDKKALADAAHIVGGPEDHMMFSPSDVVYLKFKKGDEVAQGKQAIVFIRNHREELDPNGGNIKIYSAGDGGEIVRVLGALQVESFDPDKRIARAVILEAFDPIERGFEVADVPPTLADVPPKPSRKKVTAKIVAATRELGTLGQNQMVFINAGANQGVEVGNRFLVLRQGDPWRQNLTLREHWSGEQRPEKHPIADKNYPWDVVGEVRALYVRPDTSTGLITDSLVELNPGDRVELREGY
jgi:LysM domain